MRKSTLVLDFLRFSVPNKVVFGRTVPSLMIPNRKFPTPDVPYEDGTTLLNNLETAYINSRGGDHQQIAFMHQCEDEVNAYFRKMASYVERISDGDETAILSTGFHLSKQPIPSERPEFTVEAGDAPGFIWLRRKAVDGASSYVWQSYIGEELPAEPNWIFGGSSTQAMYEMKGLSSASKVWFRVAAVTKDGMQPFTDPIMKVVP